MRNQPGPSDMLEELADKTIAQMERLAVTSFESALDEMISFHQFLIDAYATTDTAGQPVSFAQIGNWTALHEQWIRQYRRLFERAVEYIGRESDFIDKLAHVPFRLMPRDARRSAPAVTAGILDISNILVHRLEGWLTRHRMYEPARTDGEQVTARLAGSDKQAYEDVILRFIGSWESTLQVAPHIYSWRQREIGPEAQWQRYSASWPFLQQHLRNTAYLLAVAVWNEDEIGANYYGEALLRWLAGLHDLEDEHALIEELLAPDLFDKDWTTASVEARRLLREPEWDELSPTGAFSAFLKRMHEDVIFVISGVMFAWYIENRQNTDIAVRTVVALFRRTLEEQVRPRIAQATRFRALMVNLVRTFICGERFKRAGYGAWLDRTIALLDGMTERRVVPGRIYEPSTRDARDDVLLPWLAYLAASLPVEGDDGAVGAIVRLAEGEDAFPSRDASLRHLLYELRRAKTALESNNNTNYLQRGIHAINRDIDAPQQIQRLMSAFDQIITGIEAQRRERLRNRQEDRARLNTLRERVEQSILTGNGGIEIFRDFHIVRHTAGNLVPRYFTLGQIEKGYLTEPQMADPPSNFNEWVAEHVQRAAVRHIWSGLGTRPRRTIETPEEATYLTVLMDESRHLAAAGHTPILFVDNWNNPAWIGEWLRSHGEKPSGVQVERRNDAGTELYLGTINNIDVYRVNLNASESLLLRADLLRTVRYGADASGQTVDVHFQDGEQEGQSGKLVFRFFQEVEWAEDEVIVLRYPTSVENNGN